MTSKYPPVLVRLEWSDVDRRSERERQANIARNRALLAQLDLSDAAAAISVKTKSTAKPIQPRVKKPKEPAMPTRQSTRLRKTPIDPNETPAAKRKREVSHIVLFRRLIAFEPCLKRDDEERRRREEEERLEAAEREREAKRPRHHKLDLDTMGDDLTSEDLSALRSTFQVLLQTPRPKGVGGDDVLDFDDDKQEKAEVKDLKEKFGKLKIVARAKVTQDRVYSAAYHPEPTKDLILFGGQ